MHSANKTVGCFTILRLRLIGTCGSGPMMCVHKHPKKVVCRFSHGKITKQLLPLISLNEKALGPYNKPLVKSEN